MGGRGSGGEPSVRAGTQSAYHRARLVQRTQPLGALIVVVTGTFVESLWVLTWKEPKWWREKIAMNLSAPVLSSTWEPKLLFRCFCFCRLVCRDSVCFPCHCSNVLSHSSLNDPHVPVQRVFCLYLLSHHEQPQLHSLRFHHVFIL